MKNEFRRLLIILALTLIPTLLVWFPFFFRLGEFWNIPLPKDGMATIVSNYDGPLYLVAAKTLYNKDQIKLNYQFPLSAEYYTAHFPLFPIIIRLFGNFINYPYAMLLTTLMSSFLALYFFYKLAKKYLSPSEAVFLTAVFSILPARWLVVRSVGSADPLFVASVIASIFFFKEKKYLQAGIWGALAQATKSPAILLFVSYGLFLILPYFKNKLSEIKKAWPLILMPLTLLLVFGLYAVTQNDFLAYFHSGDNIHLFFPPFQIFNFSAPWVGTFWTEEVILVYLIGALGVTNLFKQKDFETAIFSAVFFLSTLFVSHRDIIRYTLPLVPFLFLSFREVVLKKEFKIVLSIIVIPIYLYSLAFISQNVMPISNWAPFL